jgi:hypothetical protein
VQTAEGLIPLGAALAADVISHSTPGLNVLLSLLAEPAGAAAGVAYLMTLVLSSPAVDPSTLAPKVRGGLLRRSSAPGAGGAGAGGAGAGGGGGVCEGGGCGGGGLFSPGAGLRPPAL